MSQQVQELIDKIKQEGVQVGEQKAIEIESDAQQKAEKILSDAQKQADELVAAAKQDVKKLQESTHASLQQAARDTILSLHQEIENILQKIITQDAGSALSGDTLGEILTAVINESLKDSGQEADIEIAVNKKDLTHLEKGFLSKLQKKVKEPIKMQASDDIAHGFTISFDGGRSCFEFTDASLGQFLGSFVNAQIAALIKEAV